MNYRYMNHYFFRLACTWFSSEIAFITFVSISRGKRINLMDSANYGGIALNSVCGKMFDLIILWRFAEKRCASELQFGFKRNSSTNVCTTVLQYVYDGATICVRWC